ncbi:MAG: cation diffusion facilitator family transporter [Methanospirillum sp.]|nr:cation diffusion facilitator family transporter [Methanospirillum sp.]
MKNGRDTDAGILFRVALVSMLVNIGLVLVKLLLSSSTGSLSLRADAVHSFIDLFGSAALILGLVISRRESSEFPYGLYKVENIVAVVISFLLFGTAYEIALQAIFAAPEVREISGWVLALTASLILVPYLFGRYEVRMGTRYNSPGLVADGKNFTADVLSSMVVFLGLLGQYLQFPVDRLAAIIVAVFIVISGWQILVGGMKVLLDASIDHATLERIRSVIIRDPAVVGVKSLRGRNSGRYVFVEADILLRALNLEQAHRVSQRIEQEILRAVPNVDHPVIHYEPWHTTKIRYAVPLADYDGAISGHFGEAPFFALLDIDIPSKSVERTEVVANPHRDLAKGKGLAVANFILTFKPAAVATREEIAGKGPGYVFVEAGLETVRTDAEDLGSFIRDRLESL